MSSIIKNSLFCVSLVSSGLGSKGGRDGAKFTYIKEGPLCACPHLALLMNSLILTTTHTVGVYSHFTDEDTEAKALAQAGFKTGSVLLSNLISFYHEGRMPATYMQIMHWGEVSVIWAPVL